MTSSAIVSDSETNKAWQARCQRTWRTLLDEALVRGFYGSVSLEIQVQDGTIQNLRQRLERNER